MAQATADRLDFSTFRNIVNGQKRSTPTTRHGINPATAAPLPEVPVSTLQDVDDAVAAARAAFPGWAATPVEERQKALHAFAEALKETREQFAPMLTTEQGNLFLAVANIELDWAYNWLVSLGSLSVPEEILQDTPEKTVMTRYTPLGVAVGIVPWNYPVLLACGKIAPCLVTGNCMIIKPSPYTPYCDVKLVELAQRFFPPGVLSVLSGDDELGPWMTIHEGVDKISFTRSSATGKKVMVCASKTLKRVTLELGGNDPAIICANVNIEDIAPKIATLAFINSGQLCLALKRIYIHHTIYEKFRETLIAASRTFQIGEGTTPGVMLGPVKNSMQYERVQTFFSDIKLHNQKVLMGGNASAHGAIGNGKGHFIEPTIVDDPGDNSRLVTEEPFGPIVPITPWYEEKEVIARANDTKMGLGVSVWSNDLVEATRIAKQLDAGSIWVNAHFELSPMTPFGGMKWSGIGSERGLEGLKAYCGRQVLFLKK